MGIKVLELYSGIGGMHFALLESQVEAEVICAIDINTIANDVYKSNFLKHRVLSKNIQSLTKEDFNKLGAEMILMSPPCQPHTRNGLKKDKLDNRSNSLIHLINVLPELDTIKYILLENVKGFEDSLIRNELVEVLQQSGYIYQEFLLSPNQFCIPNSRLRYYLLAVKNPNSFCFENQNFIMEVLPKLNPDVELSISKLNWKYKRLCVESPCFQIGLVLNEENKNFIPETVLKKYGSLFDIVTAESTRSCCFTKGYSHFVEGTGSVLSLENTESVNNLKFNSNEVSLDVLKSLKLRYFSPMEISGLMGFPKSFKFPSHLTDKQKYRLLGNSINVHVVALLIKILTS